MAKVLRPIGHDERLSIIDHLDELRSRLIVCGLTLVVAFGLCFWQNHRLLHLLNRQLPATASQKQNHLNGLTGDNAREAKGLALSAAAAAALTVRRPNRRPTGLTSRRSHGAIARRMRRCPNPRRRSSRSRWDREPFTTTLTVSFYAALTCRSRF